MTKVASVSALPDAAQSFMEVYRRQQKKIGALEKRLIAATIILAILLIVFFVLFLMAKYYYSQLKKEKVCTSKECIESAMALLQSVDLTQNPCEDFYAYACGNFHVHHPIPENYFHNSWFIERENQLSRLIVGILKKPPMPEDLKSVREMKEFYQSCTNRSELNSMGLKPLYYVLELLELPKFIPSNKTVENFSLGKTLALAQRYLSQDILVAISVIKGTFNTTDETEKNSTILKVREPNSGSVFAKLIKSLQISPVKNGINVFDAYRRSDIFNRKSFFKFRRKTDFEHPRSKDKQPSRQVVLATLKFIAAILQEITNDLQIDSDAGLDNNSDHHATTAYKIITFGAQLAKDSNGSGNYTDNNSSINSNTTKVEQMTFATLQILLDADEKSDSSSNRIDWREFINTLFEKVNNTYNVETDPIMVEDLEYFKFLTKVLGEAKPETIQRYIWWRIVEEYAKHTTSDIRAIYFRYYQALYGESVSPSRSHVCANLMKDNMNVALSHEMSRINNFSTTSEKENNILRNAARKMTAYAIFLQVREMLKDIETAFEGLVKSMTWMDPKTKFITLDKAKSVTNEIGYASWLTDAVKIEGHYHGLDLKKSEFLVNLMRISQWEVQKILEIIGPVKDNSSRSEFWYVNPLQVNAYYSRDENAIIIPAGILQTPFYFRGLQSLNYGAIGTILGHELTHGFDIEGKNFNKHGKRQENWWPNKITEQYEAKAKCFVKQYENFTLYEDIKLNGTLTLAENIADNGGIRESFRAYQLYKARHGIEEKLPGFENFTHEQLLFLSYANIWCEASLPKYYKLSQDSHSPQRVRVLASLQNLNEFSLVFSCSSSSFMNPRNKCVIW